ncbi:MAG: translocation/assembly module TamB, partial [Spirochaetia bacterium]|nr:translocation/assembly module TamB [Spirochaetia bacterium]
QAVPGITVGGYRADGKGFTVKEIAVSGNGYAIKGPVSGVYGQGAVSVQGSLTGTGQRGGNGAQYEVRVRYGEGTGKVRVGVMGYEAAEGLRVHGYVEAQGVLTLKKVLRGEYEELMSWSGEGQAGLIGKGYEVREQKFGLAGFREGGSEGIAVALKGEGYSGSLRAGIDGQVVGELSLREFEPGKVIAAEAGLVQELGGLRYTGDVRVGMKGGDSGLMYEGEVTAFGPAGAKVGGVDVSDTWVKVTGKGDRAGVKGTALVRRGDVAVRYEGSIGYEALELSGKLGLSGKGLEGGFDIGGGRGKYSASGKAQGSSGTVWAVKGQVTEQTDRYDFGLEAGIGAGKLVVAGSYGKAQGWYEGQVKAEGVGFEEIRGLAALAGGGEAEWLKRVEGGTGSIEGSLQGQGKKVSWVIGNAEVRGLVQGTLVQAEARGIVGDEQGYELKELRLGYGAEGVTVSGKGKLSGDYGFRGNLVYKGQGYGIEVGYGKGEVTFKGSYGLSGSLQVAQGSVRGRVQAEGLPLAVGEGLVRLGIDGEFRYGGTGDWEVKGERLQVGYEGAQAVPGITVGGYRADGKGFELAKMTIQSGSDIYDGTLQGTYNSSSLDKLLQIEAALINRNHASEKAIVSYKNVDNQLEATLKLENIDLEHYIPSLTIKGLANCTVDAKGAFSLATLVQTIREKQDLWSILPPATLAFDMKNAEFQNAPFNISGKGTFEGGNLLLNIPALEGLQSKITNANLYLQIPSGNFALDAHASMNLANSLAETDLGINGKVVFAAAEGFAFQRIEIAGNTKNMQYHETSILPWEFSGSYQDGNLNFQGGKGALSLNMLADGTFDLQLVKDLPVLGSFRGSLSPNGSINASVENFKADLKSLGKYLSTKTLDIRQGLLKGNLTIKGPLEDPELFGELELADAAIYSRDLVQGLIGPFTTKLVVNGKNIETPPTEIPLEQGKVTVAATGLFDRWNISDIRLNVSTKPGSIIALSGKIAGITVIDAKAAVDLVLSLNDDIVNTEGKLYLEKGQVLIDPQGFLPENAPPVDENALAFRVKLAMTFGKQLEVFIPDNKIPLVKGFTNPSSFLNLQYDSISQDFSLDGKVDLRTGYVLYYFRNFFLKSGVIEFAENSTKFNPLITATAELRESTLTGPVRITLSAEKASLENLNPRLTSVPFLPETQLIALMSGGVLALDTSKPLDIREAAIASSEFLPQFNIFKTFEQTVRKALGLDIVYIRSSFIQRWLLDLTKPATEPATEDPLARYLDKSEFYMGKYLTDSAFLYAALKFTENPLVSSSRLRLDSEFGIELDAPFGILDWSITPSLSEGSLVTGQKLSLSWQFQY